MDIPWSFGPFSVAAFIPFIGVLIFVHELGHFLAAKIFDIKVVKFSLGFGPALLSFRHGETVYQVAAVPLGGFVRMVGDQPGEPVEPRDRSRALTSAPLYQRAIVYLAGPAFNLAFPVMCFFAYNVLGPTVESPVIGQIEVGKPADRAGLKVGDRILSIDGERTWSFERVQELIQARPQKTVPIQIERDGKTLDLTITPDRDVTKDLFGHEIERGLILVSTTRHGPRIGVADPAKNRAGFETGDRILSIEGKPVADLAELESILRKGGGQTLSVVVARPGSRAAGGLLHASWHEPIPLTIDVPPDAEGIASIGLAPSEVFLRRVIPGGAADRAGLRAGDQLVEVDGQPIRVFASFILAAQKAVDDPIEVVVRRGGALQTARLQSDSVSCIHDVSKKPHKETDIGIGLGVFGTEAPCSLVRRRQYLSSYWASSVPPEVEEASLTLTEALMTSFRQTGSTIGLVAMGIYKLVTAEISVENVSGPLQLFKLTAQVAELGFGPYLKMMALISVNLGLINLLPIPIFDGGHLLFCLIEAIKRRPLSMRTRELAGLVGLLLVVMLFLLAFRNDFRSLGFF